MQRTRSAKRIEQLETTADEEEDEEGEESGLTPVLQQKALQLLLALPMDVEDADAAAESLAPSAEQMERWAGGEALAVLAELVKAVEPEEVIVNEVQVVQES